jgi:hypothetical protein
MKSNLVDIESVVLDMYRLCDRVSGDTMYTSHG